MTREAELLVDMWSTLYKEHHKVITEENYDAIKKAIKALNQEPKTGHWIPLGNYDFWGNENSYKCSECGDIDTFPDNFCHNCGAKMERRDNK